MFRSGSTLVEQMLSGHPDVSAGGEIGFIPNAVQSTFAPFPESMRSAPDSNLRAAAAYQALLAERFPGSPYVTDKRPDNFLNIGLIKHWFPTAKIVHTMRDALDNCLSIYFLHLSHEMNYAFDLMDIGHYYCQYRRLMDHWKWLYGADIVDVSYDALVTDPRDTMRTFLEAYNLAWDEGCMTVLGIAPIRTASHWQVREPLHARSSGRSRHYLKHLQLLQKYLQFYL